MTAMVIEACSDFGVGIAGSDWYIDRYSDRGKNGCNDEYNERCNDGRSDEYNRGYNDWCN